MAACIRFGPSRTVEQDAPYGVRLLADIAIGALSPAVDDPTTEVQAGRVCTARRLIGPTSAHSSSAKRSCTARPTHGSPGA
ncbi:DUF2254 family protein [Streptomyces sp. NPDC096094]|uniref:DUF2254 family protein n=1 Tax=Streptomyces sp. NPDC096094 TaxID=3366073 RepID=UPI0037F7ED18